MLFKPHSDVAGKHALFSASKPHWLNYDDDKVLEKFDDAMTASLGTKLHEFAKMAIELGQELPRTGQTLNLYVNDCIGHRMEVEQVLFYSYNIFGTTDAISFENVEGVNTLRVFDLKNGKTPSKEYQLEVYAALFCLEYKVNPFDIDYDLRIYQFDDIEYYDTDPERIAWVMARIKEVDKLITESKEV